MKTIVIHPKDPTTDFLSLIYRDLGFTVVNKNISPSDELIDLIKEHDRVILMGHGLRHGLFCDSGFFNSEELLEVLRTKECIFIFCFASTFAKSFGVNSLCTGMFVSEKQEADYFSLDVTQAEVDFSNNSFSAAMRQALNTGDEVRSLQEIHDCVKKFYPAINSVVETYNAEQIEYINNF
jgi:hypothetical protein